MLKYEKSIFLIVFLLVVSGFIYFTYSTSHYDIDDPLVIAGFKKPVVSIDDQVKESVSDNIKIEVAEIQLTEDADNLVKKAEEQKTSEVSSVLDQYKDQSDDDILDEAESLIISQKNESERNKGLELIVALSEKGNARANYDLGQLYQVGGIVSQDIEKALEYFEISANSGFVDAQLHLANYYYEKAEETPNDYSNAIKWFTKASEAGSSDADYSLGYFYRHGLGVKVDNEKAVDYYQRAADKNYKFAYEELADMYLQALGVKFDPEKALFLYQRAANEDIASAQTSLGWMYQEGIGVRQDFDTARFWYNKAVGQDDTRGMVLLGNLYEQALGVEKDNKKAFELYNKAAELANPAAQVALARMYERGIYTEQNLLNAIFWNKQAAEKGYGIAQYNLARIYEEHEAVKNLNDAKTWYEKAAAQGVEGAKEALERLKKGSK